ncbi:PAS domain-containing sensor histidine kinase [Pseudoalteromonas sp. MQS005]|jgi:nitrogen fixation/metabolism regulation signal transduction histidine kinase|uniref:sensor histidine kinase n=1 Tax=Pseudoalteromonas sp. MQS005 TaxID=1854052 RepID=UPI0007E513D6|nr:ATP-binding protein [Pseudoalteromonas sp. MQS005]
MKKSRYRFSLTSKVILVCVFSSVIPVFICCWLLGVDAIKTALSVIFTAILSSLLAHRLSGKLVQGITSLETGLLNFKDGELSTLLAYNHNDELGHLCLLYNQTAKQLRQEKQWVYQRELMLDKVLQNSPQAVLLVNDNDFIVYSNHSARDFFNASTALEGEKISALLSKAPQQIINAVNKGVDGLFILDKTEQEPQTWHLSMGRLLLNNQHHRLFVFKQLTRELSRQEVEVWKKVIRIISHELNNSLGPMSSMLHSAQLLTQKVDEPRLKRVFTTIEERIKHLNEFVQGYGRFAKLPPPKITTVDWHSLLDQLQSQWQFNFDLQKDITTKADQTQIEQLLINLLKNAHESESLAEHISLKVTQDSLGTHINVSDKGKGMSETVMASALIPFYSTKVAGSGLGLALCREIVEAHHGQISLHNRDVGGISVFVSLP